MLACYLRLIQAGFRRYSTYRQAMVAGLATNVVFGFMRCAVLLTVFAASAQVAGYDPSRTVTFVWIGQGLIAVVLIWGSTDFGERVRSGDIAVDLLRPLDLQAASLAEDLGRASFALLARFTVPLLIGLAFFDLTLPSSALRWTAFGLSVLLAILVSFAIRFLLNLVAFWLLDWRGLLSLHGAVSTVLAGLAIPIAFFPGWARVAIWATPFPAIIQAPIDIAIGRGAAVLVITPLTGLVLLGAVWVAASATTFWLVEGQELPNAVTYGSGMFTSYPMSIFSGWLLRLMAFVVSGAFVAYYPALAILGKPDPLGLPPVLQYSAPLVAVLAAGVAALVWRAGLRHYVGTGS